MIFERWPKIFSFPFLDFFSDYEIFTIRNSMIVTYVATFI